jgi:hypothetical protein
MYKGNVRFVAEGTSGRRLGLVPGAHNVFSESVPTYWVWRCEVPMFDVNVRVYRI